MRRLEEPGNDLERLVKRFLPEAKSALEKTGSFEPFGAAVLREGGIRRIHSDETVELKSPDHVVERLSNSLRNGAKKGAYSATVAVLHVAVKRADGGTRDAVQVKLDHCAGTSLELFFPYRMKRPGVATFGRAFSREGESEIFELRS